jgi:hypothetical protein
MPSNKTPTLQYKYNVKVEIFNLFILYITNVARVNERVRFKSLHPTTSLFFTYKYLANLVINSGMFILIDNHRDSVSQKYL